MCVNYFGQLSPFRVLFQGLLYCVKSNAATEQKDIVCPVLFMCFVSITLNIAVIRIFLGTSDVKKFHAINF